MSKFKVLVISMLCKANQVVSAGEIIDESILMTPSETLVADKFIEPAFKTDEELKAMTKEEIKNYATSIKYDSLDDVQKKDDMIDDIKYFFANGVAPDSDDEATVTNPDQENA